MISTDLHDQHLSYIYCIPQQNWVSWSPLANVERWPFLTNVSSKWLWRFHSSWSAIPVKGLAPSLQILFHFTSMLHFSNPSEVLYLFLLFRKLLFFSAAEIRLYERYCNNYPYTRGDEISHTDLRSLRPYFVASLVCLNISWSCIYILMPLRTAFSPESHTLRFLRDYMCGRITCPAKELRFRLMITTGSACTQSGTCVGCSWKLLYLCTICLIYHAINRYCKNATYSRSP